MLALRLNEFDILVPFGENTRYDLAIDNGSGLRRVQCKSGRFQKGAVVFATCSSYAHHPNPKLLKRDYLGQVEDFAVYCHELRTVYLIPIDDVPTTREARLRVTRARNNQHDKIRFAAAYEIARFEVV